MDTKHIGQSLPILETVRLSLIIPWQRRITIFKSLIFTAFLLALLSYLLELQSEMKFTMIAFVWIIQSLVFTVFAVTCHRILLLEESSISKYIYFRWTMRETKFLGWTIVTYLCLGAIITVTGTSVFALVQALDGWVEKSSLQLLPFLPLIPGLYVLSRLSVLLPATAIDENHNLSWAWQMTKRNGWRLLLLVGILPFLISFRSIVFSLINYPLLNILLDVIGYLIFGVIEIALLSFSFRFLRTRS